MNARNSSATAYVRATAALLCAALPLATMAAEADGAKLFEQKRCYICHDRSKASLGPPLVAIAARHAPQREVMLDVLARKIVHGGGGNWGVVPMVPNQWVSPREARVLAEWILAMK
jgi:cytochrome c